jgi:hypothetical protein
MPADDAPAAAAVDVAPGSVAQHAQLYAQNLESLLAKRSANGNAVAAQQPATTQPAAAPESDVAANSGATVEPQKQVAPEVQREPATVVASVAKPQAAEERAQTAASRNATTVAPTTDVLFQKLATRVREYPRDAAAHLEYQFLQFLRDEPVPELGSIAPLPAEDRELITALLDGLSNFRAGLRAESNMLQSKKVAPLLEMADRIRSLGELNIPAAALCSKVDHFGVYEPMEPAQFKAGTNNEAVLYCEVANFSSQLNGEKQWETRLRHEGTLYNETGLNVWPLKADTVSDLSRNRRHDFYVVRKLHLPRLPVGRYLLKVTVTDTQVNRVAEATVPLQVVAGP